MTDKERKVLEEAGLLYPAPNCVDYYQTVQGIAKEVADRIWEAINNKVEVVRCKDCWYSSVIPEEMQSVGEWLCDYWCAEMHGDDYCSCGKDKRRKDERQTD